MVATKLVNENGMDAFERVWLLYNLLNRLIDAY
jgi:hypothetical protein